MNVGDANILYLEDNLALGQSTAMLLQALGVGSIEHVSTIEDALEEIGQGSYNLCILDIWIAARVSTPVIDAARALALPVILITGEGQPQTWRETYPSCCVLSKPVSLAAWRETFLSLDGARR